MTSLSVEMSNSKKPDESSRTNAEQDGSRTMNIEQGYGSKKEKSESRGNKNELRIRLRKVLAQRGYAEAVTTAGQEGTANDADTTDGEEGTSEDNTTSEENAEESRKKQHEAAKLNHRSGQVKYTAPRNERGQSAGTKREKEVRLKEDSETEETSDSDISVERGSSERLRRRPPDAHRRSRHVRSEFTIKDVEGSLTYFTGDDKLPIEK